VRQLPVAAHSGFPDSESPLHQTSPPHRLSPKRTQAYPAFDQRICSRKMSRQAKTVSMILALTMGLAVAAWSSERQMSSYEKQLMMDSVEDPADKPSLAAVLDNDWIEKLPYVTDLQPGWEVCPNKSNPATSVETRTILVMTDNEDHQALLEKQVPGSLEGFPVMVVVDRTEQYRLEGEKMMAKVQPVIDDPANQRFLRIPRVVRMEPSTITTKFGEPITAVIDIVIDSRRNLEEVQSKAPKTIGGFQTRIGWAVGAWGVCFPDAGNGCDKEDDVNVDNGNGPVDDHNNDGDQKNLLNALLHFVVSGLH